MTHGGTLFAAYWAQHQERLPPDDEVWYQAPEQVTLYSQSGVVSHTFNGGKGVVKFNAPVTTMKTALRGTAITDVTLPACVELISSYAFYNCVSLVNANLPRGISELREAAFRGCVNLALASLPDGVTKIGDRAFERCAITISSLPSGLKYIVGNAFIRCRGITSITFNGTPSSISISAFSECSNLTDIYVPWSEGEVVDAPWGASNATIHYNHTT